MCLPCSGACVRGIPDSMATAAVAFILPPPTTTTRKSEESGRRSGNKKVHLPRLSKPKSTQEGRKEGRKDARNGAWQRMNANVI
jgi:hypothetical protein